MVCWNVDWARASMESEVGFGFRSACTVVWVEPVDCCESENSLNCFVFSCCLSDEFFGLGADLDNVAGRHRSFMIRRSMRASCIN